MSLTGLPVKVLAIVLGFGIPLLAIVVWSRLDRGRGRVFGRVALILASQLAAVFLVGILVNDEFGFYTSWREVSGLEHHSVTAPAAHPGAEDAALRIRTAHATRVGHGTIVSMQIPGIASGIGTRPARVYLPPQYGSPAYANRQFPVVELIAGAGGHPDTWDAHLDTAAILDASLHAGTSSPMIVVMPTVTVAPPRDTECVDVAHGPQVDTYLTTDVPAAIGSAFRVAQNASSWALMGYSTGGYCAVNLALRHPDIYKAAVSLSGYDKPYKDASTGELFGHNQAMLNANTPIWRLQHLPSPEIQLLLVSTHDDSGTNHDANAMLNATRPPLVTQVLALRHGGHNFSVWRAEEPSAFAWLSHVLPPPLAPAPRVDGAAPSN
jgi:S-formylglutathione hydrolase FrmB